MKLSKFWDVVLSDVRTTLTDSKTVEAEPLKFPGYVMHGSVAMLTKLLLENQFIKSCANGRKPGSDMRIALKLSKLNVKEIRSHLENITWIQQLCSSYMYCKKSAIIVLFTQKELASQLYDTNHDWLKLFTKRNTIRHCEHKRNVIRHCDHKRNAIRHCDHIWRL